MSLSDLLFWIFSLATCGAALAVVFSQNVARMAFWLIIALGSMAGLFFLLNADFVGTAQLLIYVGGTLVLLIFGVMLTASGPFMSIKSSPGEGVLSGLLGSLLLALIMSAPCAVRWDLLHDYQPHGLAVQGYSPVQEGNTVRPIGFALLGLRPDLSLKGSATDLERTQVPGYRTLEPVGYLVVFLVISVHLLVVLVGAAYLARTKRRRLDPASVAVSD